MKFVVAVIVLALGLSPAAFAAGGVAGKYSTTIKSPSQLKGKWVLTLAKSGKYTIALNGQGLVRGRYTTTGKTIRFAPEKEGSCKGYGTYAFRKSGTTVRFIRKREAASCHDRAAVLSHRFTKVR